MEESDSTKHTFIDLHIHSTCSDGLLTPEEIVTLADQRGLCAISITDHDTMGATLEAMSAGEKNDVEVVPGIEMSVTYSYCEVHLLGYYIQHDSPALEHYSQLLLQSRKERAVKIIEVLRKQGVKISLELVKLKSKEAPIGRPHIAEVLVEENYAYSMQDAFNKYLGENRPADIPKLSIGIEKAIRIIKESRGLAFFAHPATVDCCEDVIHELLRHGLDGIETIHPKHSPEVQAHFHKIAQKYDLLESGGSDCHGGRNGYITMGTLPVPYTFLERIKERL